MYMPCYNVAISVCVGGGVVGGERVKLCQLKQKI